MGNVGTLERTAGVLSRGSNSAVIDVVRLATTRGIVPFDVGETWAVNLVDIVDIVTLNVIAIVATGRILAVDMWFMFLHQHICRIGGFAMITMSCFVAMMAMM